MYVQKRIEKSGNLKLIQLIQSKQYKFIINCTRTKVIIFRRSTTFLFKVVLTYLCHKVVTAVKKGQSPVPNSIKMIIFNNSFNVVPSSTTITKNHYLQD